MSRQIKHPSIKHTANHGSRIRDISPKVTYESVQQISTKLGLHRAGVRKIFAIPERTQIRYEKNNTSLSPALADRVERFNRIYEQAVALFENEATAKNWLLTSTPPALEGETPLEALGRDSGAKKVEEILYRIEYGIFG